MPETKKKLKEKKSVTKRVPKKPIIILSSSTTPLEPLLEKNPSQMTTISDEIQLSPSSPHPIKLKKTKKASKTKKEPKTKKAPKEKKEPKTKKIPKKIPKKVTKKVTKKAQRKPITIISSSTTLNPSANALNPSANALEKIEQTLPLTSKEQKNLSEMSTETDKIKLSTSSPSLTKVEKDLKKSPQHKINMTQSNKRYNEEYIELMDKLAAIQIKQGEPFRARAYQKAQETIMVFPGDITSPQDLKGKPNIGPTIMEKLNEYTQTGTLKILEREKNNPVNILTDVYGIGPKKAKELVDKGITTITQLRENQHMINDVQKIGLKYYEDVLKRIPRAEIDEYNLLLKKDLRVTEEQKIQENPSSQIFEKVVAIEIVGSYRRGAQNSGDIDVIITAPSENSFKQIIDELLKQGIIVAVLSRGPSKCLVMAKIPSSETIRRVDFLYTTAEEFPFAILYFTGSKMFNTMMRQHAVNMGLTMNEHGLYKFDKKTKGEKVSHQFTSEKDIFDYLQLPYVAPEKRIDGSPLLKKVEQNLETNHPPLVLTIDTQLEEPSIKAPNPPLGKVISGAVEPKSKTQNPPLGKVEPKSKTQKKKQKDLADDLADDLAQPFPKVDDLVEDLAQPFPKVEGGIQFLDSQTEEELIALLIYANEKYRNSQPIMTDNEYDILEDFIKAKYPNNKALKQIGAPPITKNKATLPYFMGSMDKIKPDTNALANWKAKYTGPYVLSCKLDGVSGLYTTEGKEAKLYTRGDGKVGQDISYLIPYLRLPKNPNLVIRGEFIIPKATFNTKYKATFANPRNMVSGIVNQKTINKSIVQDVDFVAYEVIKPLLKPSEQFATLEKLDINVVQHSPPLAPPLAPPFQKVDKDQLKNELLSETLINWRENYPYEIDGVIVANDQVYPERKEGNPEHAFAFKMVLSEQIAEAKVVDVIWTPSKDGYLKPRVRIEPIHLGGVKIEYATGFNGQFIQENKIGVGAVIEIIRSGDVIPHIRKVTTPATQAKMPNVPYKWNDTHVDVMLEDIESDEVVKAKNITGFFKGIEVEGLSSGNISRIIQAGFDSVAKILQMTPQDFLQVEGFKEKTAQKLYTNIQTQVQKAPLVTIMAASNIFGRGFSDKKLELILDEYPDVLQDTNNIQQAKQTKIQKIAAIKGMAAKTAETFVDKIPAFLAFVQEAHLESKLQQQQTQQDQQSLIKKQIDQSHPLYNKSIVFTGFRDKQLEEQVKAKGGKIGSSVSKNTFIVLTKDPLDETGKVLEAKKLNVKIMTPEEFINLFHF